MTRRRRGKEATPAALHPLTRKTRYHGLKNQGATCYLNSVLQVLYMTKDFREAVKGSNSSQDSRGCIDYHLHSVFNSLKNKIASTQDITNHLGIKKVNEQHDAAECFDKILSCSSSKASEIFQGVLTHKNTCSKCGLETESNSPFWSLPLTLNETECYPVTDAVQKYFQESKICGENQLYCNKCNDKTDSSIKLEMHRHPDVLTLLLKRFKFDYHYMDYVKIKCSVQIPYTLEIPTTKNKTQRYQLYAYVEHSGELRSGHYTAEIKSEEDGQWYNFNDSTVTMNRYQRFQVDKEEEIPRAYLLFYKKTTDPLDADSCGASTPECFKSDVETTQREGGENAAARIDSRGIEDETKNRGEIKSRMGVGDKQSKMTGTNDDRFMSTNNKCTEHRRLSEINIDDNLKLSPDIDGQSRNKPQNGSEETNDLQQNPETVQSKIKKKKKEVPNDKRRSKKVVDDHYKDCDQFHCKQDVSDSLSENSPKGLSCKQKETKRSDQRGNEGKKPEGHCTETGAKHQILSLANTNEDELNQDVLQEEQHKFHNKHSEVQDAAGINNFEHSKHLAKRGSAAKKYKIISVERSGDEEIIKVLPDKRYNKDQQSKSYEEVRKIENSETLQKYISTSSHEGQERKEENHKNDKSFQAREKSERLFGESEGNHKTVQLDKDTQNNLGDIQPNMNSVTQEITAKIDTNPQNNNKTNDGETSNCIFMQKQKDLLEQQIQSDEKFSTGSENIENVSESPNLTEPSTEKNAEVSPDVKIQQDGRNQSGKNRNQRRKSRNKGETVQFGLVCPRS